MTDRSDMETCPYRSVERTQRWRDAVGDVAADALDPHAGVPPFKFNRQTRIGTAGSCFAKRIAESLANYGFAYQVTESGPSWLADEEKVNYGYGVFSARYGNIYTVEQLVQTIDRAYGRFAPSEPWWPEGDGVLDPFRPRIQPGGFASVEEADADRASHLEAVRQLFESIDVFVFTLGLTESWRATADGAVFPICPGCGVGRFDPARYRFHNFGVVEVIDGLNRFLDRLGEVNTKAKVILTVSPVPLVATMEPRHVLQSTVYSKSVLRVAADEVACSRSNVTYFGSYEIITATGNGPRYFEADKRNISSEGVAHVMRSFFKRFSEEPVDESAMVKKAENVGLKRFDLNPCDEEQLARSLAQAQMAKN